MADETNEISYSIFCLKKKKSAETKKETKKRWQQRSDVRNSFLDE